MEETKKTWSPDNLSFFAVVALAFLIPTFFLPFSGMALDVSKILVIGILTLIALVLWLVGRLIDGVIRIPKSLIIGSIFLVPLAFLASSIFSPTLNVSLFGQGFEIGTFSFIFIGTVLALVVSLVVDSRNRIFYLYSSLFVSAGVISLYHIIRLFAGPSTFSFGIFTDQIANSIGKWNDFGVFFGLMTILSLLTIEILRVRGTFKWLIYGVLAVSLFLLSLVNFSLIWWALAVFSVIVFVYAIYLNKGEALSEGNSGQNISNVPIPSLVVLLVSIFFVFASSTIGSSIANKFGTTQIEVRPSWGATIDIAKETLKASPLFGSGPNRFSNEWSKHKPDVLNSTIFWATDFNAGVGLLPTFAITTGAIGILAMLVFLGSLLYRGVKSAVQFGAGRVRQYLVLSSFLGSVFLWLFSIIYVPNAVVFSLAFLMTGVFVSVLVVEGESSRYDLSLLGNPKVGFISVLSLIFLIIVSAALGYLFISKAVSVVDFQRATKAVNIEGNLDNAERYLTDAVGLSESDVYRRGLSQLGVARLNQLLSRQNITPDEARTQFTALMGSAIDNAKKAIEYDETNYVNWLNVGGIYEAIVPLGVAGAYDEAVKSYQKATELAPKNPLVYFTFARLEIANKDTKAARDYLGKALELKNNYTEALFLLSQIEASDGNLEAAISRADQASLLAPNDVGLFFQLGLLKYTARDYTGAISALERATSLTTDYANAMYFLGLSYDKAGREAEAIKLFERIGELNPDNAEVKNILTNLKAGRDAFANVPPPKNAPEKQKAPPIKESSSSEEF